MYRKILGVLKIRHVYILFYENVTFTNAMHFLYFNVMFGGYWASTPINFWFCVQLKCSALEIFFRICHTYSYYIYYLYWKSNDTLFINHFVLSFHLLMNTLVNFKGFLCMIKNVEHKFRNWKEGIKRFLKISY